MQHLPILKICSCPCQAGPNADRGIYYYTTYTNRRISAVELRREDLDAAALIRYPMRTREDIFYQNAPGTES